MLNSKHKLCYIPVSRSGSTSIRSILSSLGFSNQIYKKHKSGYSDINEVSKYVNLDDYTLLAVYRDISCSSNIPIHPLF